MRTIVQKGCTMMMHCTNIVLCVNIEHIFGAIDLECPLTLRESDHKESLQYLFAEDVCDPVLYCD
jgi:hypothetical protein